MEDPSIKKRLIDFGIDEHEYDETAELSEERNINSQFATTKTTTTDIHFQQQRELLQHTSNNNNSSNNNNKTNNNSAVTTDLPPELPPPKQNKVKNSKKNKTKSKIPRSPSLASSTSASTNSTNNKNNNNFPSTINYSQSISGGSSGGCINIPYSPIPPQTPPLPLNYQQSKLKHMNGGGNVTPTTTTPITHKTSTPQTPTTPFGVGISPVTPTTPHILVSNSVGGNNVDSFASTPTVGSFGGSTIVMGGGSVPLNAGGGVGANGSTSVGGGGIGGGGGNHRGSVNMARRTQMQISPIPESPKNFQYLTLTVRKDENGYGMKVSGDNPVFVESVKPGGAAQIAGLVAGDMILKVNGQEVRMEKHPTVVGLIKASTIVELAVKRSQKMTRPSSVGIVPSTPILSGRDRTASITGPQPVDSIKRREMETYKIQTLQKMLEQEKLNLERLKGDTNDPSYKLSEANIRKLREQLRKIGAEDAPPIKLQPTANNNKNSALLSPTQLHQLSVSSHQQHHLHAPQQQQTAITPQPQVHSSPAFLSLLPRSLSSLSLGTRKNKIDKDLITAPMNNTTDFLHQHHHHYNHNQLHQHQYSHGNNNAGTPSPLPPYNMSQSLHQPQTQTQQQQQQRNSHQQALFYQQQQQQQQQLLQARLKETPKSSNSKSKNKFAAQAKTHSIQEDVPPPLPQRNPPRQLQLDSNGNSGGVMSNNHSAPISDLDMASSSPQGKSPQPILPPTPNAAQTSAVTAATSAAQKKRAKTKTKALSDPKMSTQMFLQMETTAAAGGTTECGNSETDCIPPPLPPRQPGMLEESPLKGSFSNLHVAGGARPPPNSIETLLNYPLVATCTPVHRDNMAAAFPLSQRPNIVQQLQQHQQQQQQQQQQMQHNNNCASAATAAALGQTPQNLNHLNKHRRVVSSPENMHPRHSDRINKTTSGSWELVEKDGEITPPGTPPPPYLTGEQSHDTSSGGIFIESHHFTPLAGAASPTPPITTTSTPALTTHSSRILAAQSNATQKEIISMEDEDASDQEGPFIDENGPFNYLQRLLEPENVAFLAVFLNYVLSNSEPSPLLFYLITGLYKEGTAKDMRKWAYEIHSTFLVPRAPLSWYRKDESLAREVDNVLQSEFDKVEILRKVFWKSRKCARDTICAQLREFNQTRTEGLGTIYGPTDAQLAEARGDKQREQHIFEETLMRKLQVLIEEYEKDLPLEDPKKLAICSALSTVIHRIFITRSHPNSIVDRVHHFVSREKSFKSRLMGKNRKMIVRGHPLVLRQYYEVTHCNHCQTIIWGVSPQGYHCTDCKLNIHRPCSKVLDENCPGPLPQSKRKEPHNDNKISKFMGKIRPRTSSDFISMEKRARHEDDFDPMDIGNERLHTSAIVRQPSDRRPDVGNQALRSNGNATTQSADNTDDVQLRLPSNAAYPGGGVAGDASGGIGVGKGASGGRGARESNVPLPGDAADLVGGNAAADTNAQDAAEGKDARRERLHQQHQNKSAPVSVNRSESYKERLSQKRNRNSRRKTSDPSLTSRPNDEQADVGLSNSNYTASSNSSLSSGGGSESPSTSMEQMGGAGGGGATATATGHPITHHHSMHAHHTTTPHHHVHQHSHQDSFHGSIGSNSMNTSFWGSSFGGVGSGQPGQRQWNFESDDDDDLNEADWSSNVTAEVLAALTDAEKKRQEIINEIYQTERSHVRILKLLERLFLCPLQESNLLTPEHLMLLFPPALLSLREIHATFEQQLKQRRIEQDHVVTHIGDLLSSMFYGKSGEDVCQYAAQFCARQQIALEALKEKRRKDEQLHKLLNKAESHKACRRLQLKDLLPAVLQRLTKYPLLFENLYKVTIRVVPENTTEAEAIQRALESSKKILVDVNQAVKTAEDAHKLQNIQKKLDKSTFDKDEFKNLDLTQYRLIHDGSLTMKKNPSIQLHGLLFEDMIVLLTKQDDKYSLKYLHATRNTEVNNKPVSPIMSIDSETLVRQEAADKNSFFLIKTKTSQMLELRAPSSSECKTWFKHISDAAEQYKPRSKNANHEPVDDPAIATLPHSNTKESLELTPERPPPASATATVTTTPLAPMMPIATATSVNVNNNNNNNDHHNVQLRNGRRESTPTASSADHKMRLSHNELSPSIGSSTAALSSASTASLSSTSAVNRTMSTRSCGEPNNNNDGYENASVTLRHTQSARQASNGGGAGVDEFGSNVSGGVVSMGSGSKRDSASIVYSNNSNNTRTLMQSSPPLVEPTAIQISISPAHTAEPVLTPAERLRRLDASIREGLLEKQKIICDMFRLPVEHFHEIVDIAAMPEAPKDSADIALAAYAQVQSLTEVLNEYMHVTHEQEISAVSTAVCDQCHEKQQQQQQHQHSHGALTPLTGASSNSSSTSTMNSTGSSNTTQIAAAASEPTADMPPPLPPPNRQVAQQQTPTTTNAKTPTSMRAVLQQNALMDADIHEDDDGYCEIDELRLPALPPALASKAAAAKASTPPPPLPPPAGSMKAPLLPPPPTTTASQQQQQQKQTQAQEEKNATNPVSTGSALTEADTTANAVAQASTAELVKRQSTISADSIPEESADEVTQALNDDKISEESETKEDSQNKEETTNVKVEDAQKEKAEEEEQEVEVEKLEVEKQALEERKPAEAVLGASDLSESTTKATNSVEPQSEQSVTSKAEESLETSTTVNAGTVSDEMATSATAATTTSATDGNADEHMEVNDAYEALSSLNDKLQNALAMVDNSTQTSPLTLSLTAANAANLNTTTNNPPSTTCGPNRIQHANSLEPSVPCHALNTIVSSLNSQISLLLPKINERDMERERLRKENQHLRELLNAMHERQRVEAKLETPTDANAIISAVGDTPTADVTDGNNTNTTTPNINSNSPAAGTSTVENTSVNITLDTAKATVSNTTATTTPTAEQPSTPTIKIEATPITTTTESKN